MSAVEASLSELLQSTLDRTGETPRAFASRAQKAGHTLSHTTVYGILRGTRSRFDIATLDAIADTGGLSRAEVYSSVDLPPPGKPFVDEVAKVEGVDLLDRRERDVVVELLKVMVDRRTGGVGPDPRPDWVWPAEGADDPHVQVGESDVPDAGEAPKGHAARGTGVQVGRDQGEPEPGDMNEGDGD